MNIENLARGFGTGIVGAVLVFVLLLAVGCGGGDASGGASQDKGEGRSPERAEKDPAGGSSEKEAAGQTTAETSAEKTTAKETAAGEGETKGPADREAAELARAEVGEREIINMMPAGGEGPDPARPLPKDPPEGIEVYPATTNRTVEGPIEYDRRPPTNGDHAPLWQNCGFYERPIQDRHAVHSMDHGVVWITYRPNLPAGQIEALRPYGEERYVIVSPYPGLDAPVIATSWRVQLELKGPKDPRLRQFVDGFRISELSPLSGNRCALGVGNPQT